ncbi:MAG: hypothetical protein H7Y00_11695 [Fimbriimonadaceae bacterium]|nr:hypothetical protein [Chitinophagales bacterium]
MAVRKNTIPLFTITLLSFFIISCDKKEGCMDDTASNYDPDAEKDCCCEYIVDDHTSYKLHMHQFVGAEEFVPGNLYTIGGVKTQLDVARFYISNIRLVDSAGNETPFTGIYLLADPGFEDYDLGDQFAGNYTKIRLDIGLDSATNHSDPGDYPSSSPLSYQSPAMNWGWDFGYMFMLIHGEVDTDNDGITDGNLINHLGTDDFLTTVEIDYALITEPATENIIHLTVNWADFYNGIDLSTDYHTEVTDDPVLANALRLNIPDMITAEE